MSLYNGDLSKWDVEMSPDQIKPDMTILITHFVSPQLFWYIELGELEAEANTVRQVERKLISHCHDSNQLITYDQNQYVIVQFLPCYPKKYIRGLVCQSINEKYLVWALDYGFTINCLSQNLWLLPKELQQKCVNLKAGSMASVIPLNGSNWSKEGLHMFDQKLEESPELSFIPLNNNMEQNVGQLFWKERNKRVNAANLLINNEFACLDTKANKLLSLKSIKSPHDTFNINLAVINETGTEPRLRVRKLIQQISGQEYIYKMNSKSVSSDCNHQFDILLGRRSFNIPKSALKLSKVSRDSNSSYSNLSTRNLDDFPSSSQNPPKFNKSFDIDNFIDINRTNISNRENVAESMQNLDKEKIDSIINKMIKISLNKESSPESLCLEETTAKKSQCIARFPLAHSVSPVIPLQDLRSFPFHPNIQNAMKGFNFHTILPTQLFAWPHLRQPGNSLLLIDGPNTGKTWCYLPALCSLVIKGMQSINKSTPKLGPVAILLTDMENVSKLTKNCVTLMEAYDTQIRKVVNTSTFSQEEMCTVLLDCCGILITTLDKLNNLLKVHCNTGLKLFDPNYLALFVCDDYDRLRLSSPKQLNGVLQKIRGVSNYRFGLILVSQQWHAKIFPKLMKNLPVSPLILFGDFLQAAIYGGLKLETVIGNASEKLHQLLKYLPKQKLKRTIIYCKNQQELDILTIELTKKDYQCISLTEAESQQPHQLLLVTDELSNECVYLANKNIELLIHFSMPETWTKFAFRFHSMMDNITNLLVPTAKPIKISTYLFLDQSNHQELLRLLELFDAHGIEIDKCIRQVIVSYQQEMEMMRPFCPYLLSSGECKQKQQCNKRHHVIRSDVQHPYNPMQQSGTIMRCKVCKVYDPVHIAFWPIEYKPAGSSTWLDAPNSISRLSMELAMSMAIKCQPHQKLKTGDVCVVYQEGQFKRVRIVDLPHDRQATVQLMDTGTELLIVKPTNLFECEAKFQTLPSLAMDVRLSHLEPAGGESKWTTEATKWVYTSLSNLNDQQFIQIIIDFALIDVIYVNEIVVVEKCRTMRTTVHKLMLQKQLILEKFGQIVENKNKQLKNFAEQERNANRNWPIEKKAENVEPERFKNSKNESRIDLKSGNISRLSLMMDAINEFLRKKEAPDVSKSEKNRFIKEKDADAIIEEPPVLDSQSQFVNSLINELNNVNSSSNTNSALQLIQNILASETPNSNKMENNDKLGKNDDIASTSPNLVNVLTQPSGDQTADALKCAIISNGAVCPNVKWRQTLYHIDIIFEQQVPQYKLVNKGNTIVYSVTESVPPQHCVLNLLGEVKIISEQQHGYNLFVKLAKLSLLNYWPSLLNSLFAQQHFRWLSYDTDRAKSVPQSMCHNLWQRYLKNDYFTYNTNESDEDSVSPSSDEQSERDEVTELFE